MLLKVVIIGPESTGKSTLAKSLAAHFDCLWVPEFARQYLEKLNRPYTFEDLTEIAKGQINLEEESLSKSKSLLLMDTDLHVIKVWSEHKFGKVDPWIVNQIKSREYDAYILTDIDMPWQEDPLREHPEPEKRQYFFDWYKRIVTQSGKPFVVVTGSEVSRSSRAIQFISKLLSYPNLKE